MDRFLQNEQDYAEHQKQSQQFTHHQEPDHEYIQLRPRHHIPEGGTSIHLVHAFLNYTYN